MIIEGEDFRLIPISENIPMFDLELLYIVRPKGKEERKEFKVVAYGIGLEAAIKKIAQYRVSCKHDIMSLLEYFSEFKKEIESLTESYKL